MSLPEPLTFEEKLAFLGSLDFFSDLDENELFHIAAISQQYGFEKDNVVIHQGDVADNLYIIESGRVEAVSIDENGVSRRLRLYLPRQMFEDEWLFTPGTHPASIGARQDGRMLLIPSGDFLKLLAKKPRISTGLDLSAEAESEFAKTPMQRADGRYRSIKLVPDERIEFETRRSRWLLAAKITLPLLGAIIFPTLILTIMADTLPNLSMAWIWGFALLVALVFLLWIGFQWLDWANDYLIITNKRLVHYEFNLRTFSGKGQDTPIGRVQSVEIDTPNLFSTILSLGTARVTTAALSVLYFDYLNHPGRVKDTLDRLREAQKSIDAGKFKSTMRKSVENYFKVQDRLVRLKEEPAPKRDERTPLQRSVERLRKFRLYSYRKEEGNVITYRKHVFALLVDIVWPGGVALFLLVAALALYYLRMDAYMWVIIILGLLDALWIVWRAEDWRNDTFQVTDRYVIDVDRRPFGFGESRKQAQLDNIQNVEADRPNILATLFNFGNVEIETAGADSRLVFENVSNPEGIKNDIFKKRSKFEDQKRKQQDEQNRREYAVLLDVFMEEQELDRVKRRTPDFSNAIDEIVDEVVQRMQQNE